ncbi:O-antigen ligase family protein [Acidocella aromatica]|uniref:O-antigen ligase n=1 Tax=Acidocella aromatica TaxID=1303579 RepID=A0A840VVA7_9PROT|nr:O-antigen ligase family protein [Acidocella aromatica]MBB5374092.1 O-antigen ligase [Acidocella aromatica]
MRAERPRQIALAAALLVPLGLLHAFVLAEIGIGAVDVLFLAECARRRDFAWMRQGWVVLALLWWGWLLLCSTPLPLAGFGVAGWGNGFVQAFVIIRLLLFTAALQNWVLTTQGAQRAAWWALALCAAWIGLESWQQYLTGRNIFGDPRWADGALTGPFWKPRAGALYMHLLYPALLPPVLALLTRPGRAARLGGLALAVLGVLTSVLIGQRMGVALTGFGLAVAALFVRQLRGIAIATFAVAALAVALTPVISPPTYAKLVQETAKNLDHFLLSPYGELYTRAAAMTLQSPWHGWGYNGFRTACSLPRFDGGFPSLGIAPTQLGLGACNLHPHNYYMQALTDSGFPGLLLFVAMALSWLRALGTGLWHQPEPLRLGLFIAVLTYLWPIGSTDAFPTLYMLGWLFLLLGFGLALAPGRTRHG